MPRFRGNLALIVAFSAALVGVTPVAAEALSPALQEFRDIYRTLVEIDTTDSGDTLRAAEAMAAFLKKGEFPPTTCT